jgi:hypothetical protein
MWLISHVLSQNYKSHKYFRPVFRILYEFSFEGEFSPPVGKFLGVFEDFSAILAKIKFSLWVSSRSASSVSWLEAVGA